VQLDHVARGIVQEDLLGFGTDDAPGHPVLDAEAVQLLPGVLNVGDGEGDVRPRRIFVGGLRELRHAVHAHQMDLRGAADIHPVTADAGNVWSAGVGGQTEDITVERARAFELALGRADANPVVVQGEHLDGHSGLQFVVS
jgi:hypothetical protein